MLIGLLSDTHIAFPNEVLPPQIKTAFRGVDLILHAGDIWIPHVLDELETIASVKSAWGDDDMEADLGNDKRMMEGNTLTFEGVTLWLIHEKPHYSLLNPEEASSSSKSNAENPDPPDVVIFGHSHHRIIEHYKNILLINPGSPTVPDYIPKLGTVALLTLSSGKAEARLVQLE